MKKLLIYLKDYKKETILGPWFKLLEASFELIVPLVVASMIDTGIANNDKTHIYKMAAILVALGVTGLLSSVTAQFFAARAAVGFATKLRHALFDHIQKLSFSKMDQQGTATLITRMTSDVNQVQNGVNMVIRLFLRSPFIVFGAMIMAFFVDVKAAVIFAVVIPLLSIVVFAILMISIPLFTKVQAKLDQIMGVTRQNLTGVRVIRAFSGEKEEIRKFSEENEALKRFQLLAGRVSALMNPLTYILINAALLVLLKVGAIRLEAGALTQGQIVALINYMSQILVELIKLANLIITVTKAIACGNRIQDIFEISIDANTLETEIEHAQAVKDCKIQFERVSMAYYQGGDEAVTDVTLRIKAGETIGIIGGTGSGKSTLVNLIPRFYEVTKGSVFVDGKDVRDYPLEELRRKTGIVLQKAVLFQGTIRENLLWGNEKANDQEIWDALKTAQALSFVKEKPNGLDTMVEQEGRNLSGGQKQRLSIARALIRKPEILILDDSSSALDYATDLALRKALKELPQTMTVIIVSQRASSLMHADQIVVLDDGNVAGMGTHQELLQSCEIYQEIYQSQFEKEA